MTERIVEMMDVAIYGGALQQIPNADKIGEEIIRCKDCKYYRESQWVIATDVSDVCTFFSDGVKVEPNGFCKWGERK